MEPNLTKSAGKGNFLTFSYPNDNIKYILSDKEGCLCTMRFSRIWII